MHGQRWLNIFHCHHRNFSSNLNADLFKNNLTDSGKCCKCGYFYEDCAHFLFSICMDILASMSLDLNLSRPLHQKRSPAWHGNFVEMVDT